jgi:hypothetical protein
MIYCHLPVRLLVSNVTLQQICCNRLQVQQREMIVLQDGLLPWGYEYVDDIIAVLTSEAGQVSGSVVLL